MKHLCILLSALIVFMCTGFSQSSKDEAPQKHYLNYQGEITDLEGKRYNVDNISISGKLRSIKMYEKPVDASRDPAENITAFDLDQIYSIEPAEKAKCDNPHYKNKHYTEIIVTLNSPDKNQRHYVIESSQKIECYEISAAGPLEKKLTFNAIKKLTITGRTERQFNQLYSGGKECRLAHN
ncbi:MAG: hypothetical protein K2X90_02925 [Candidatus Babeliaceae bacterium]|nr:hypothetical protein [Candidatus Babeliaceae bacterium]